MNYELSVVKNDTNYELSVVNYELSVVNYELSVVNYECVKYIYILIVIW